MRWCAVCFANAAALRLRLRLRRRRLRLRLLPLLRLPRMAGVFGQFWRKARRQRVGGKHGFLGRFKRARFGNPRRATRGQISELTGLSFLL